jgi:capsular exopolysaccharide synthesis family protein
VDINNAQNTFSLGKIAAKIMRKWYWLALSVALCLAVAFLINRYTAPLYTVSSSVYIKQSKDRLNSVDEVLLSRAADKAPEVNLYNEVYFLTSKSLIEATLSELDFRVSYFMDTETIREELYKNSPVEVVVDTSSKFVPYGELITCTIVGPEKYVLKPDNKELQPHFEGRQFEFGKANIVNGLKFTILLKNPVQSENNNILFRLNTAESLADEYRQKLKVESEANDASILVLTSVGLNADKEKDFLNKHIETFIRNDLREKNMATAKTSQFIDQLLSRSSDSLNIIQGKIQTFKSINETSDIATKSQDIREELRTLERERATLGVSIRYADFLIDRLQQNADISQIVIPADAGFDSPILTQNIKELSELQAETTAYGIGNQSSKNPLIAASLQRIETLKGSILRNITTLKAANSLKLNNISSRIASYRAMQQRVIPVEEREFDDIQRSFRASNELVSFLMQKKAEAGIARASTASDYKPVDMARVEGTVQSPVKNYLTALIIGLLLPIALITVKDSFNNKLVTKRDLMNHSSLPLLGIIGYDGAREKAISYSYKASLTAESFRSVRTNLSYFIDSEENHATDSAKVLLFVSSISREGKTYCSKYLSFVLSLSGKKTLLINADMRKPDRNEDLEAEGFTGLSHYLSGKATIDEIILRTKGDNLFYVKSGEVPPNPSELLITPRMQHLIETVKASFDYIIIDTPPIGAFSDSVVLLKYADLSICVVRQNHTTKPLLEDLNELHQNNPHIKMALLFNYVDMKKLDSGYRRSYYSAEYYQGTKPSWWKRLTA